MITGYSLFWRLAAKGIMTVELAAACARFQELTDRTASRIDVHPGQLVEAEGLIVVEDRRVAKGCWLLGCDP